MSVRFDVVATGELTRDLDDAADRQRLMELLDFDFDLCCALLCGEAQLLCSGVDREQASAFAAMMRECGIVSELRPHGESGESQVTPVADAARAESQRSDAEASGPRPSGASPLPPELEMELELELAQAEADTEPGLAQARAADPEPEAKPAEPPPRWLSGVDEAEVVDAEVSRRPKWIPAMAEPAATVSDNGSGVFEAAPRLRPALPASPRWRLWIVATTAALLLAWFGVWWGMRWSISTDQAYVQVSNHTLTASQDGEVAAIVVRQSQPVKEGEPLLTLRGEAPEDSSLPRSSIERSVHAGMLDEIAVREGQRVKAGDTLGTVRLSESAYVVAYFDAVEAGDIPSGAAVRVALDDYPEQPLSGMVEGKMPLPDTGEGERQGRVPVLIRLSGGEALHQRLYDGMAAKISIRRHGFVD